MIPQLTSAHRIAIRNATGLSREKFAQAIGASLSSINRWERCTPITSMLHLWVYHALHLCIEKGVDLRAMWYECAGQGPASFVVLALERGMGPFIKG